MGIMIGLKLINTANQITLNLIKEFKQSKQVVMRQPENKTRGDQSVPITICCYPEFLCARLFATSSRSSNDSSQRQFRAGTIT